MKQQLMKGHCHALMKMPFAFNSFIFLLLLSFLFPLSLFGQSECQTSSDDVHFKRFKKEIYESVHKSAPVTMNLQLIAVQDDNGSGGVTASDVQDVMNELDAAFLDPSGNHTILFDYCVIYPKDSGLLNSPDIDHAYVKDHAINLLIVPFGGGGRASGNRAWADIGSFITNASHEIGHCFGLLHTFQETTVQDPNNPNITYTYRENVTRDPNDPSTYTDPNPNNPNQLDCYNCEIYGDGFCDTPADRQNYRRCPDLGSFTDACNQPISDDVNNTLETNYMKYFNGNCRSTFTPNQRAHMHQSAITVHASRIDGNEPNIDYTVITGPGTYDCSTGDKFAILNDITFTQDLVINSCTGFSYLTIAPNVTLTFENNAGITLNNTMVKLHDRPYPECSDGPTTGDRWMGIDIKSAAISGISNSTISNASIPVHLNNGGHKIIIYQSTISEYFDNALKVTGSHEATFQDVSFENHVQQAGVPSINHIEVLNNQMWTAFFNCSLETSNSEDIGFSSYNSTLIIREGGGISNFKRGIDAAQGFLSIGDDVNISVCSEAAVYADNMNSFHLKNSTINACGTAINGSAVKLINTENLEIRNNLFVDCPNSSIQLDGESSKMNSIRNNIFNGNGTFATFVSNDNEQLLFSCNQFQNSSNNYNIAVQGMINPRQGISNGVDYDAVSNEFNNMNFKDLFGSSEMSIGYYHLNTPNHIPDRQTTGMNFTVLVGQSCSPGPENYTGTETEVDEEDIHVPNPNDYVLGPDPNPTLPDSDGDGVPDVLDPDDDNDGDPDVTDPDDDGDGDPDVTDPDWCISGKLCGDPVNDPVINDWEDIINTLESDCDDLYSLLKYLLDGGDGVYLNQYIALNSATNPNAVLNLLNSVSPFVSVNSMLTLFNYSQYYSEQQIANVLIQNPDLLLDKYVHNYVYSSGNFGQNSLQLISTSINNLNARSAYHVDMNECDFKSRVLKLKLQNRYILFGDAYQNLYKSNDQIDNIIVLAESEGRDVRSLSKSELEDLKRLAEVGDKEIEEKAQAILRFFYGIEITRSAEDYVLNFKQEESPTFAEVGQISINPNPTENEVRIINLPSNTQYTASVFNLNGELLLTSQIISGDKLSLISLDEGMYIITVQSPKGEIIKSEKVVLVK